MNTNTVIVATHSGVFHADDAMACAILRSYYRLIGRDVAFVRTRDIRFIANADVVVDVGGIYDPERGRFDHHQCEGAGRRGEDGVPYAAAGLVWRHYGRDLVESDRGFGMVDQELITPIDAVDTGHAPRVEGSFTFSSFIASLNIDWNDEGADVMQDDQFLEAVSMCDTALNRAMVRASGLDQADAIVAEAYDAGPVLVLPKFCPWQRPVVDLGLDNVRLVVFPALDGGWRVQEVPTGGIGTPPRLNLPTTWRGLSGERLIAVTQVADATFCHSNGFIAGAETREGALALARAAMSA